MTSTIPTWNSIGQGIANIVSPIVRGCPPRAPSPARHERALGGEDARAGIIHALTLAGDRSVCCAAGKSVPLSALAAILMNRGIQHGDWEEIPEILKLSRPDIAVWLLT